VLYNTRKLSNYQKLKWSTKINKECFYFTVHQDQLTVTWHHFIQCLQTYRHWQGFLLDQSENNASEFNNHHCHFTAFTFLAYLQFHNHLILAYLLLNWYNYVIDLYSAKSKENQISLCVVHTEYFQLFTFQFPYKSSKKTSVPHTTPHTSLLRLLFCVKYS